MVDGSSMIGFSPVITDSERDMLGIEPGPLGSHTSALTTELQEAMLTKIWLIHRALVFALRYVHMIDLFLG